MTDLQQELEAIRERASSFSKTGWTVLNSQADVPRLLTAVEAVLSLTQDTLESIKEYREQRVSTEGDDIREDYAKLIQETLTEKLTGDTDG